MQMRLKCKYINQMFDKDYVLLSREELTNFVDWLLKQRKNMKATALIVFNEYMKNVSV